MKRCKLKKKVDPVAVSNLAKFIQEHFELNAQGQLKVKTPVA